MSSTRDGSLRFVTTWLVCIVLLVFSSNVGFSFERGSMNTAAGSEAQGLVSAVGSQDALVMRIQTLVRLCNMRVSVSASSMVDYGRVSQG